MANPAANNPAPQTPIAYQLWQALFPGGQHPRGADPQTTAMLVRTIETLERSKAQDAGRIQSLSARVDKLSTSGVIHHCKHCWLNQALCCIGINPCKSI